MQKCKCQDTKNKKKWKSKQTKKTCKKAWIFRDY